MKLEGETSAAGDGQGDDAESWDTSGTDVSRSWRKDTVILADTQLSFHIISPSPVGRELTSKNHSQGHSSPVHPIPPSNMCSHWPTSNKEAEGAAQGMHMQQGKWVYFHLCWPSQHSKSILWRTGRYFTEQSKIKSQFFSNTWVSSWSLCSKVQGNRSLWLWRNVLMFRKLLCFSLQRKPRQTGLQKWKSLSKPLNFTSQFPRQGLPVYLTSLPELSLEKGAQTGCKGTEFPNKSSSTGNKTLFCHIINEQCPVLMTFFAPGKERPLLILPSWCLQCNIQFFHGFTFMIRAIKIDYLLTCLKGIAFIYHILCWAKYRISFFLHQRFHWLFLW